MKLVLIGGGENGHHNTNYETAPFDKEIIRLTEKTQGRVNECQPVRKKRRIRRN